MPTPGTCKFWTGEEGTCKYGTECKYLHSISTKPAGEELPRWMEHNRADDVSKTSLRKEPTDKSDRAEGSALNGEVVEVLVPRQSSSKIREIINGYILVQLAVGRQKGWLKAGHCRIVSEDEIAAKTRETLYQRQAAALDAMYKKRDAENAKAHELHERGNRLWKEGEKAEAEGNKAKAKEKKDEARRVQAEIEPHKELAQKYKQQAVDLDWKHNGEMFEHVQTKEHTGQKRDGSWIDLHGLSANFAEHKASEAVDTAQEKSVKELQIITGAGHHSGKDGPVIKTHIVALLKKRRLKWEDETAGSLVVSIK